jgi:pimeloyl-ACP methyl ester carboxylesterase
MTLEPGFVETNGIRLHYLAAGESGGEPVVLLHGNTHCGGIWAPLIESLAGKGLRLRRLHAWPRNSDKARLRLRLGQSEG